MNAIDTRIDGGSPAAPRAVAHATHPTHTFKLLLKREFWEHKGGFFWAPMVVGSIIVAGTAATIASGLALKSKHGMNINGQQITNMSEVVTPENQARVVDVLSHSYIASVAPLLMVMAVVVFFYCLGNLFDERKDRSILFW